MVEKIAKYLILSLIALTVLVLAATFVLSDDTVENTAGPLAPTLLDIKHGTLDAIGDKASSFVYWISTTAHNIVTFDLGNRTPSVTMRMPPPLESDREMNSESATRPATTADPVAASETTSKPAPEAAGSMNETMPAPEPAPAAEAMPTTEAAPEKSPEQSIERSIDPEDLNTSEMRQATRGKGTLYAVIGGTALIVVLYLGLF